MSISHNSISAAGAIAIAQSKLLHLVFLDISRNNIGAAGVQAIAQITWLNFVSLNIADNPIEVDGYRALTYNNWRNFVAVNKDTISSNTIVHASVGTKRTYADMFNN